MWGKAHFFGEQDDFTHSRVAVIGSTVEEKTFLGPETHWAKACASTAFSYKVVAVLQHTISNGDEDMNSLVYVPYSAMSDSRIVTTLTES